MAPLQLLAARWGIARALRLQYRAPAVTSGMPDVGWRSYATLDECQEEVQAVNDKFVEARDEIEYAMEDAETVYFNESANDAKEVVQETLDMYQALLAKLDPGDRGKFERGFGLKMEQLKAEAAQLDTLHAD